MAKDFIVYILLTIGGFIALFEPYFTAIVRKKKFEFRDHIVRMFFGFIALLFGVIKTLIISGDKEPFKAKVPHIEILQEGWYVNTEAVDTIKYEYRFGNLGEADASSFNIRTSGVGIQNNPRKLVGIPPDQINYNGLISGMYKNLKNFIVLNGQNCPDTIYFHFLGYYDNKTFDYLVQWYPGLDRVKTVSPTYLNDVKDILLMNNK